MLLSTVPDPGIHAGQDIGILLRYAVALVVSLRELSLGEIDVRDATPENARKPRRDIGIRQHLGPGDEILAVGRVRRSQGRDCDGCDVVCRDERDSAWARRGVDLVFCSDGLEVALLGCEVLCARRDRQMPVS